MGLGDYLTENAKSFPDRIAIIQGERRIDFKELNERANRLANVLLSKGVKKGDHVSVMLLTRPEYVEIYFACYKIGAASVHINARYVSKEIEYIANQSDSVAMILDEEFVDHINPIRSNLKNVKDYLCIGKNIPGDMSDYEKLLDEASSDDPKIEVGGDDVAFIIYTGGTTGEPKGAVWTHGAAMDFLDRFGGDALGAVFKGVSILSVSPFYHIKGWIVSTPFLCMGCTLVLTGSRSFNSREVMEIIEREKVKIMCTVGDKTARDILDLPDLDKYNTKSLMAIMSGAAKFSAETKREIWKHFKRLILIDSVGQSESLILTKVYLPGSKLDSNVFDTVLPGTEKRVVDEEGNDVKPGEIGELIYNNLPMMREYYKDPSKTAEVMKEGWYYSGDLYQLNEDGSVRLIGRKKETIVSGGEKIHPPEVEDVLRSNPNVSDAVVMGIPDVKWGESVMALVKLKKGAQATEEELIQYCKEHIASYKKPRYVEFVDSFPTTEAGKILKAKLKEEYKDYGKKRG
ncbi:MAG: class I adenylate-forming enzyme family protein [Halobacteriota archaeon]|nr:class I adenylate-forming enzyme family protein [Halobacteriota archaeon]